MFLQRLLHGHPAACGDPRASPRGSLCWEGKEASAARPEPQAARPLSLSETPHPLPSLQAGSSGFPSRRPRRPLLGQRPHLERIRFMKLVAVSQALVPLIPQRPVRAVNKDSNLFIKNGPPSPQASQALPVRGREGLGRPRVRVTPLPLPPGSGHSASDSPSDPGHAWDSLGTGRQAAPASPLPAP